MARKFGPIGDAVSVSGDTALKLTQAAERMHMSVEEFADWAVEATAEHDPPQVPLTAAERQFLIDRSGLTEVELAGAFEVPSRTRVEGPAQQRARMLSSSLTSKAAAERLGIGADAIRHRIAKKQLWSVRIAGHHRIPEWQFMPFNTNEYVPDGGWDVEGVADEDRNFAALAPAQYQEPAGPSFLWSGVAGVAYDSDGRELPGGVRFVPTGPPTTAWATLPGLEKVVPHIPKSASPLSVEGLMTTEQDELLVGGVPWTPLHWLREGQNPEPVARLVADLGQIW
jgi:hypothetical protein